MYFTNSNSNMLTTMFICVCFMLTTMFYDGIIKILFLDIEPCSFVLVLGMSKQLELLIYSFLVCRIILNILYMKMKSWKWKWKPAGGE